jgi:carbon-monoxide dehydrogenase medium subunit
MKPPPFTYVAPGTIAEAVSLLEQHGDDSKLLAGGQSLIPLLSLRLAAPSALIDLNGIDELSYHRVQDGELVVGALCRHREIELDPAVLDRARVVTEAVSQIGHVAIRNRGTVGGSVAHADPSAEWAVLAVLLDATMVAIGPRGVRHIAAADFFQGFLASALEPDELLTEVRFPLPPPGTGACFVELARRHGDFAMVSVAATIRLDAGARIGDVRVAASGAAPMATRLAAAEQALIGVAPTPEAMRAAAAAAAAAAEPPADLHGDVAYRRRLLGVVTRRALTCALERHLKGDE